MVKMKYKCLYCQAQNTLRSPLKKFYKASKKGKSLIEKRIKCKKCNSSYNIEILESEDFCYVICDNSTTIDLDETHLSKVVYSIGDYDRGVQDEIYWGKIIELDWARQENEKLEKKQNIIKDGLKGENKFKNYLNKKGYDFLYINQDQKTFPRSFYCKQPIKRPDFLVFLEKEGQKYIDVKNYSYNEKKNKFRIQIEDYKKLVEFQKIANQEILFAYVKKNNFSNWYFISLNKVGELMDKYFNEKIHISYFEIDELEFKTEL